MIVFDLAALVLTALGNIILALLALRRNPASATHRLFAALGTAFALWAVATFFAVHAQTPSSATWWIRIVMFLAVPQAVLFMLLMHTFPRASLNISRRVLIALITVTIAVMAFALTPYLFKTATIIPGTAPQPQPGLGMVAFVPLAVGAVLLGLFLLIKKNVTTRGLERIQARYLLIGTTIMFTLIISLNFVAVAFLDTSKYAVYGPLFTLPFISLTAYSIIRYRLMDIRAAIARSLSFSFLVGAFLLLYSAVLVLAVPVLADILRIQAGIIAAIGALLSVLIARYVQEFLRKYTDRFLFQRKISYSQALVTSGRSLSRTILIKEVTGTVLSIMRDTVRTKKGIIFLHSSTGHQFIPRESYGAGNFNVTLPRNNALVEHLSRTSQVVIQDELALTIEQTTNPKTTLKLEAVRVAMRWLDASVSIPLVIENKLTGIILLGEKISGAPYLKEDADFFAALAPLAATALENARLYQESLEFSQRLQMEVKRATRELELANQQLKDLDQAKSEFLSIASHQLYTPLTALRGYLSMLLEEDYGKIEPRQKPIIDILDQSAQRLIGLIKNLLDISRIERGKFELNLEAIDLVAMAGSIVQDLLPNARKKELILEFHRPPGSVPRVVADRMRLRQVMLNFIDNAIKYTEQGRVDVSVTLVGDELNFSVTDTGRGISAEEITRLFTKFTRVGGKDRLRKEGTGLGLYVAQQIIREHRGDVEVLSPGLGQGSTFSMKIPHEKTATSLKVGDEVSVEIKAAEAQGQRARVR